MAAEIELKLSLPEQCQAALRQHPLLMRHQLAPPTRQALYNRYFDTPDQQLNQHAVALRIRRQGSAYIQTLKTRGSSQGGLHQRLEWEWPLPSDQLAPSQLPAEALPAGVNTEQLEPAFSTDFERTTWLLDYQHAGKPARIELVLDEGWASAGDQRDPIREIELELKQGEAAVLIAFAAELAKTLPLRICRISKAERGYRLGRPERARQLPSLATLAPDCDQQQAFYQLTESLIERVQCAMEGFEFLRDTALLLPLEQDLGRLQLLFAAYAPALADNATGAKLNDCCQQLRQIIAPLLIQQQFGGGALLEIRSPQLEAELEQWLASLELGQALLGVSGLLFARPWFARTAIEGAFFNATP